MSEIMNVRGAVFRPVGAACNLACDYCYYLSDQSRSRARANLQLMYQGLSRILSQLLSTSAPYLSLHWEGGEPLLAGLDFYQEVFEQQQRIGVGKQIRNRIQTNGLELNEKWIELFKRHAGHVSLGISLDGPQDIHDSHRIRPSKGKTFSQVMLAIHLLQEHGVPFSVSAVITRDSLARGVEIYEFFVSNGIDAFDFHPFVSYDKGLPDSASLTPTEYAQFLITLFDHWISAGKGRPSIACLADLTRAVLGKEPYGCTYRPVCGSFLGIDYNGDVYPCAYFIPIPEWKLGNLMETDLQIIGQGERYQCFLRQTRELDKCQSCQWLSQCNRGCSYQRYQQGSLAYRTYFCETTKSLFKHISDRVRITHRSE